MSRLRRISNGIKTRRDGKPKFVLVLQEGDYFSKCRNRGWNHKTQQQIMGSMFATISD